MITREIQDIIDKQSIAEVLFRYCRGIDRGDRAMVASAYWPDAWDDHMAMEGGLEAFLDFALETVRDIRTAHLLTNILIEIEDDGTARSESYVWAYHHMKIEGGHEDVVFGCRYLDHLEKRGAQWRIIRRKLVMDYLTRAPTTADMGAWGHLSLTGGHFPDDPLYEFLEARNEGRP